MPTEKLIKFSTFIFVFLFPLFFLQVVPEFYEYNKMALLALFLAAGFILISAGVITRQKLIVFKDIYFLPFSLLIGFVLASTLFQSPNLAITLTTPLATTTIVEGFLLYLFLTYALDEHEKTTLVQILLIDAVLLSLYLIFVPQKYPDPGRQPFVDSFISDCIGNLSRLLPFKVFRIK